MCILFLLLLCWWWCWWLKVRNDAGRWCLWLFSILDSSRWMEWSSQFVGQAPLIKAVMWRTTHNHIPALSGPPEVMEDLETGFKQAYGHLHLDSGPAMSPVRVLLGTWFWVRMGVRPGTGSGSGSGWGSALVLGQGRGQQPGQGNPYPPSKTIKRTEIN